MSTRSKLPQARRSEVRLESFDLGLVTLVPSDSAGRASSATGGMAQPDSQQSTVQLGANRKNAVVRASNIRFEDGAASCGPGYQPVGGDAPAGMPLLIYAAQTTAAEFLILATSGEIYVGSSR